MTRLVCTASLAFVLMASAAAAAPPWSAPEAVSSSSLFVDAPDVIVAADGRAIATWRWNGAPPAKGNAPGGMRLAVREPGALEFGPELAAPKFVTPLVTYGQSRVLGIDLRRRSRGRVSLRARFGRSNGKFESPRTISTYVEAGGPPSLAGPTGDLVAWIAKTSAGRRIVRAAIKSGSRFGRPVTLRGKGRANDVVAGRGSGFVFVAWERAGVVEARVRLTSHRSWGPVQRLGRAEKATTTFAVTGAGSRGYLAWLAQGPESAFLRTAVLPATGSRFKEAEPVTECVPGRQCVEDTIEHEPPADGQVLRLVPLGRDALLAWSDWHGDPGIWQVRAATTIGLGARFSSSFGISHQDQSAVLGDVSIAGPIGPTIPQGLVMFAWSRLDAVGELGDRVQARTLLLPSGELGAVEDVSDLDRARLPAVAVDVPAQRWTAVWSQRIGPDQPGVPLGQITTFLRSATRSG
jgi:hypothetical protein